MGKITKSLLLAILVLASALRLVALDSFPAGINADEAAIGYNAYSLLVSGKDEYGTPWPLVFKSFGDYKPGLYFYFVIPFVGLLGLNEWAVRLPSALFGIGTVLVVYFLSKEIFQSRGVGLFASLLLAISPWHLHFSRGGWESNSATFFITLGLILFIKGFKGYHLYFFSLLSFLASMYAYQSPRLIVPIFLLTLFFVYKSQLLKAKRKLFLYIAVIAILAIPLAGQFILGQGSARFSGLSFLSDVGPFNRTNELRGEHIDSQGVEARVLHNKAVVYGTAFIGHYLDHFRPDFLFISGDFIERNKVPEAGQFFIVELVFLIAGLVALAKSSNTHVKLLIVWLLVSPLASSMTYQTPHALRALNMVIPLTIIMGYGFWNLGKIWSKRWGKIILIGLTVTLIFEFIHYLDSYYNHYPKKYPLAWEYGFEEMVTKLAKYENDFNHIVITDRYDQPYILLLFYKASLFGLNPTVYQDELVLTERDKFNFGTVQGFGKYLFRKINFPEDASLEDTLVIAAGVEVPSNIEVLDRVDFPNGQPAFVFVEGGKLDD